MDTMANMSATSSLPQIPVLRASETMVNIQHREIFTETGVLNPSSHLVSYDVCALSVKSPAAVALSKDSEATKVSSPYFWCNFCPYTTDSKSSITEHVAFHRFGCRDCSYRSYSRVRVVQHVLLNHQHALQEIGDLNYCMLVQSSDERSERTAWHKPCFQQLENEHSVRYNGDGLGSGGGSDSYLSTETKRSEDSDCYQSQCKDMDAERSRGNELFFRAKNSDDKIYSNERVVQTPVSKSSDRSVKDYIQYRKETASTFRTSQDHSFKMSESQKTFPLINNLLAPETENANATERKEIKNKCTVPDRSTYGIRTRKRCHSVSYPTFTADVSSIKYPYAEMSAQIHGSPESTISDCSTIKYIYDDDHNEQAKEYFSQSKLFRRQEYECSLETKSKSDEKTKFSDEDNTTGDKIQAPNTSNYSHDVIVKTEPVDTVDPGISQFGSEYRAVGESFASSDSAEKIDIKKESCTFDKEFCSTTEHYSSVSRAHSGNELMSKQEIPMEMKHDDARDLSTGSQARSVSPQGMSSNIIWDCGQCEFQSDSLEKSRLHRCTMHSSVAGLLKSSDEDNNTAATTNVANPKLLAEDYDSFGELHEQTYTCRTCNYSNTSSEAVKNHIKEQHFPSLLAMYRNNTVVFYCPETCRYMSDDEAVYLSHVKRCRGSLLESPNARNVVQASLMLTLRHILGNGNVAFKRMFLCAHCSFDSDNLAEITAHNLLHSSSMQMILKLDPCSKNVIWLCLSCLSSIKLMQLKKHRCNKSSVIQCKDQECSQCHFGSKCMTCSCLRCKYQAECLLTLAKHKNNICKCVYKETKERPISPVSYRPDTISEHESVLRNKDPQLDGNKHKKTRSSVKLALGNTLSSLESVNKKYPYLRNELHGRTNKKRRKTELQKQMQSVPLKTPTLDSFGVSDVPRQQSPLREAQPRLGERAEAHCSQTETSQKEKFTEIICGKEQTEPWDFSYKGPFNKNILKQDPTSVVRLDNSVPTLVVADASDKNVQCSSAPEKQEVSVNETPIIKELPEVEFRPLSMLEWLNTESQRMLKLLK